jgi:hypothetical protein
MKSQAGHTLIEFVIAAAVMALVTGGIFAILDNGLGDSTLWSESSDLQQRARVAADTLTSELSAAGAGLPDGPLIRFLPVIEPRRRGFGASLSAITIRHVPEDAPWSTLTVDLSPAASVATIATHPGCRAGASACGFATGEEVVVFDGAGNWDLASVEGVGSNTLQLANVSGVRSSAYTAGARIVQVMETTLFLDAAERQLRREQPGSGALPVTDNVVDFQLSYFGSPIAPTAPIPPLGVPNCLFTSTGDPVATAILSADHGGLASLPVSMFTDGPYCGTGANAYDVDLLRIRTVRAVLRLQTGVDTLRGIDSRLFARPGVATTRQRMIPDAIVAFDLSPRNLQR